MIIRDAHCFMYCIARLQKVKEDLNLKPKANF